MSYRFLLLTSVAFTLFSCNNTGNNSNHDTPTAVTVSDTVSHTVRTGERPLPPPRDNEDQPAAYNRLIQGRWYDESDPKSELVFTGDKQVMMYDGKDADTVDFTLSYTSCNSTGSADKKTVFLKTDLCYSINKLDEYTLSLTYLDRGNTLVYNRK